MGSSLTWDFCDALFGFEVQVLSYGDEGGHESHQSHEGDESNESEESRRRRRCTKEGDESNESYESNHEGHEVRTNGVAALIRAIPIDLIYLTSCMYCLEC